MLGTIKLSIVADELAVGKSPADASDRGESSAEKYSRGAAENGGADNGAAGT